MKKFLLILATVVSAISFGVSAQNNVDVITLSKFSGYTPGANKYFSNLSFGTDAKYSGHIKVANDESGIVFDAKCDAFYVETPINDAHVKSIALTFITNGEVVVYMSATRKLSMSGGSDVAKFVINSSNPVLTPSDEYKYFIFRNSGSEFIVSMITVVWATAGEDVTVEVPVLTVDGVNYDAGTPLDLAGEPKRISFSHPDESATTYYMWEPDNEPLMPMYTPFTEEFEITKTGTLSYYAEVAGNESEVVELKVVGKDVEIDSITEINADRADSGVWYDLQGRKVSRPAHGIFINATGKKYVK